MFQGAFYIIFLPLFYFSRKLHHKNHTFLNKLALSSVFQALFQFLRCSTSIFSNRIFLCLICSLSLWKNVKFCFVLCCISKSALNYLFWNKSLGLSVFFFILWNFNWGVLATVCVYVCVCVRVCVCLFCCKAASLRTQEISFEKIFSQFWLPYSM